MRDLFTIADLVRLFGCKQRSLQIWSDHGAIEPLPGTVRAGSGTVKRFDRRETEIAGILAAYNRQTGAPIGRLWELAGMLRGFIYGDDPVDADYQAMLVDAREGTLPVYLVIEPTGNDPNAISFHFMAGPITSAYEPDDPFSSETLVAVNLTAVFSRIPKE